MGFTSNSDRYARHYISFLLRPHKILDLQLTFSHLCQEGCLRFTVKRPRVYARNTIKSTIVAFSTGRVARLRRTAQSTRRGAGWWAASKSELREYKWIGPDKRQNQSCAVEQETQRLTDHWPTDWRNGGIYMLITSTVEPHYNGSQGTDYFFFVLVDFCYCQYIK